MSLSEVFRRLDPSVTVKAVTKMGTSALPATSSRLSKALRRACSTAERTALNFLQRLSGVATLTRQFVERRRRPHHDPRHAQDDADATRAGKYAVRAGGGMNHRGGLDDGILIKDNHVRLAGGVGRLCGA